MSTEKYIIEAHKYGVKLELSYKAGKINKIEVIKGNFSKKQWHAIGMLLPAHPDDINPKRTHFKGRVSYTKVQRESSKSLYTKCMDAYNDFYINQTDGVKPKINGISGKKMKSIITYLRKIAPTDQEVLDTWRHILSNWHKLPDFYRKQVDLKNIDSNLNNIIIELKENGQIDNIEEALKRRSANNQ